jgi:glyoxylase-like metal-dependent hydrolase (beta-lactamase superfamily II)
MHQRSCLHGWGLLLLLMALSCVTAARSQPKGQSAASGVQRLYVLYCGEAHIADLSPWSPGFRVGEPAVFSNNCYLIQHGKDWLLWDSGYADSLAQTPDGIVGPRNSRALRTKTLASQLAEIGVAPSQVTYVAFSHTHADHVGNGNMFTSARLYIQKLEYDAAFGTDPHQFGFDPSPYDQLRNSPVVKLEGDYDVFGDRSVKILSTPGHTPGHQSLLVRLRKTGPVVLSGDVAHFRENFDLRRVPAFNFNADQSRQSMDKIAAVVKAEHAQLWINHDSKQSATIVKSPQFYQ